MPIEEAADGDRGDVARVDRGRRGLAVASAYDIALDDLGRPDQVVGREPVGPHEGPRQPGRFDGSFEPQVHLAD
ncbi:hypothetical protein ACWDA3_00390 [Nonomuraea rubra]